MPDGQHVERPNDKRGDFLEFVRRLFTYSGHLVKGTDSDVPFYGFVTEPGGKDYDPDMMWFFGENAVDTFVQGKRKQLKDTNIDKGEYPSLYESVHETVSHPALVHRGDGEEWVLVYTPYYLYEDTKLASEKSAEIRAAGVQATVNKRMFDKLKQVQSELIDSTIIINSLTGEEYE